MRETVREVVVSTGPMPFILTDSLTTRRRALTKFVPKSLTTEQKRFRLKVPRDALQFANGRPDFPDTVIIAGDEPWAYGYDPVYQSNAMQNIRRPRDPESQGKHAVTSSKPCLLTIVQRYIANARLET